MKFWGGISEDQVGGAPYFLLISRRHFIFSICKSTKRWVSLKWSFGLNLSLDTIYSSGSRGIHETPLITVFMRIHPIGSRFHANRHLQRYRLYRIYCNQDSIMASFFKSIPHKTHRAKNFVRGYFFFIESIAYLQYIKWFITNHLNGA